MVKYYPLDKIIKQGTTYETPPDRFYIIKRIGTDGSTDTKLVIGGVETGAIISEVAPLHRTSSNLLGPLDLGSLYYVVPPNTKFWVDGPSGAKMRIIGQIGVLGVGEAMPGEHQARYNAQGKHYKTYLSDSYSLGTDVTWTDGTEYDVLVHTPKTIERVILNSYVGASITGDTVSEGDFAVEFYMDNTPFEPEFAENLYAGIDALSMPSPPRDDTEELVFTLKDYPIVVNGDHTLSIRVRNVSGSDKAPASGSSWTVNVKVIAKYERVGS